MKNALFAACVALLGCGSVVIDETGDSSPGSDDTSTVSSSAMTGSSSSFSSSSGSGGASASSSSSASVGGGSSVSSSSSVGGATSVASTGSGGSDNPCVNFHGGHGGVCEGVVCPMGFSCEPGPAFYFFCNNGIELTCSLGVCDGDTFVEQSCENGCKVKGGMQVCLDPSPCDPNPCSDGFICQDNGDGTSECHLDDTESKLKITLDPETPESHIVVGGIDAWDLFSQYQVWNFTTESQFIDAIEIAQADPNGDAADFDSIEVEMDGFWCFTGNKVILAGGEQHFYLDSSDGPGCSIVPNAIGTMQVWAKMANVVSSAACPSGHGCARSGHTDALRIENMHVASDPDFFAQAPWEVVNPPSMVLRKSQPYVAQQLLGTGLLTNGDQGLFKFQVGDDTGGTVELKKISFDIQQTPNLRLSDFHVRRGDVDIDNADWVLYCTDDACTNVTRIDIVFQAAESISGNGNLYTLHATVSGAQPGESVTLSMVRTPAQAPVTGRLTSMWSDTGSILVPAGWNGGAVPSDFAGSFLWSDLSEVPHSETSLDWTNDLWLVVPAMIQTLSQ